ncbi:MAG: aminotransferase class I/II-fold pyridoxal phosphate-dependent enzyme [Vicinamibacterales bacterium]
MLKRTKAPEPPAPRHPGVPAPYMAWAKTRPSPRFDLAGSNVLTCSITDLPGASEALALSGNNDNGYAPLMGAIAARYGVTPSQVTTAQGTSGANFLVCAAMLERGDEVLVETPGYDPLLGASRLLGANIRRFQRTFEDGWALEPARVEAAMTPRIRLIIITSPHNPTGTLADVEALRAVGRIAEKAGAHVLVDEVYLDASGSDASVAASLGDAFITTCSLTKSYGLSGLRSGWVLSSEAVAARLRRARDVIDGTGAIVTERLSVLAFRHLDRLIARTRELLDVNTVLVRDFLHSRPELEFVYPAGGTVVFPRLRGVENTDRFAERLMTERETAVVPGRFFDAPEHFRIGFGGETEPLRGGLAALATALAAAEWA